MSKYKIDQTLDCTGLTCPLPLAQKQDDGKFRFLIRKSV